MLQFEDKAIMPYLVECFRNVKKYCKNFEAFRTIESLMDFINKI